MTTNKKTFDGLKPENAEMYKYFCIDRDLPLKKALKIIDEILGAPENKRHLIKRSL